MEPEKPANSTEKFNENASQQKRLLERLHSEYQRKVAKLNGDPKVIVDEHLEAVRQYSLVKDAALVLVAQIAEQRCLTVRQMLQVMDADVDADT